MYELMHLPMFSLLVQTLALDETACRIHSSADNSVADWPLCPCAMAHGAPLVSAHGALMVERNCL